jgi:hypothetical protein
MSMKVFDLNCDHDHRFEGWFASAEAFAEQQERKLIQCPVCGSQVVRKIPAASRLNLSGIQSSARSGRRGEGAAPPAQAEGAQMNPAQIQALFMKMTRRIMETTEDVGERFAEEARRIHYSEAPERAIRGSTSQEEAVALREEGIEVYAIPVPLALKGSLQ